MSLEHKLNLLGHVDTIDICFFIYMWCTYTVCECKIEFVYMYVVWYM